MKKRERTHIIIEQVEPHRRVERPQKVTHSSPLPVATQLLQLLRVYSVVARVPWRLGQRLWWWRRHPTSGGLEASVSLCSLCPQGDFREISGRRVSSNGIYLCNNVYVISITYKCRTTRKHSRLLCLPAPWPMPSVLEPWPTWIWASVVRDLGTCGMNNELIYDWRSSEPQLTSHLPLPNVALVLYRE